MSSVILGEDYVPNRNTACVCVCVRLYCADKWCLLSFTERETTLAQRKEHRGSINMKTDGHEWMWWRWVTKRIVFSPFGILERRESKTCMCAPFVLRWFAKGPNERPDDEASVCKVCAKLHGFKAETFTDETICCKSKENATQLELPMWAISAQLSHSSMA